MTMHYKTEFDDNLASFFGSSDIAAKRTMGIDKYAIEGFPTTKNEQWKYTSVYHLGEKNYPISQDYSNSDAKIESLSKWYIYLDGSKKQNLPSGVSVMLLEDALNSKDILQYLNTVSLTHSNTFIDLNIALMTHGYYINVAKNINIDEPLHIVFANTMPSTTRTIRNIINMESNSQASIIEHYIGNNSEEYFTNVVSEFHLHENSKCNYYRIQQESKQSYHIGHVLVSQHKDSEFKLHNFSFGGLLERTYVESTLAQGSSCTLNGLTILSEHQHIDHNTLINHVGEHTISHENFKGVFDCHSKGIFKGDIKVNRGAKQSSSKQSNKNILLSPTARVVSQPQLEIYDCDVACEHGSTIGELDRDAIFYLNTRGVEESDARNILVKAFAMELVENIDCQTTSQYIANTIDQTLSNLQLVK